MAYGRIAQKLAHSSPIAAANHEDVLCLRMYAHGNVRNHLVIDELILLRQHHIAVKRQKSPKLERFEHIDALKLALSAIELTIHANRKTHIGRMLFCIPKFHIYLSVITLRYCMLISSGPVIWQPFFFA